MNNKLHIYRTVFRWTRITELHFSNWGNVNWNFRPSSPAESSKDLVRQVYKLQIIGYPQICRCNMNTLSCRITTERNPSAVCDLLTLTFLVLRFYLKTRESSVVSPGSFVWLRIHNVMMSPPEVSSTSIFLFYFHTFPPGIIHWFYTPEHFESPWIRWR